MVPVILLYRQLKPLQAEKMKKEKACNPANLGCGETVNWFWATEPIYGVIIHAFGWHAAWWKEIEYMSYHVSYIGCF